MAQQDYVATVMESMGWTDGNFIPVANIENRQLLEMVNKLLKEKADKTGFVQTIETRVKNLRNHFANSEQEINQNLKLLSVHKNQTESEYHLYKLAENKKSTLQLQIRDIYKELDSITKYRETTKDEITKISQNIETMTGKIQWAKGALVEWQDVLSRGDEANKLIEKYCKLDASRAEMMETKRRLLFLTIGKQRNQLISACEQQKTLEQILDRTSQLYRQTHTERRQMISIWKDAINQMNQREMDIKEAENNLETAKQSSEQMQQQHKEQIEFLEQQIQNNKDAEYQIAEINGKISNNKMKLMNLSDSVTLKENEVVILRKNLLNISNKLTQQRQKNRQISNEKITKENSLEEWKNVIENLKQRLDHFKMKHFNAQDRLRQLDELIEAEEKNIKILNTETTNLSGAVYRSQQQLMELENQEKVLKVEIGNLEMIVKKLKEEYENDEKELEFQTKTLYDINFQIEQVKNSIKNMKSREYKNIEFDEKISKLVGIFENKQKSYSLLQSQLVTLEYNLKKLTQVYDSGKMELEKMIASMKEKKLYCNGSEKIIKQLTKTNEEKLVEESILKMRINQFEKQLRKQNDKLYNLEKHKIELELAMNQRFVDINIKKDLLYSQKRQLMDEHTLLRADIAERSVKIETLQRRYHLALDLLGKNDDGSIVTAAQIKIKVIQEKELLLREGNQLNAKVLKAESDIKAMENTLRLMNYSNDSYRKTFENVDEDSPFMTEMDTVQDEYRKGVNRLKGLRTSLIIKSEQNEILNQQLEDVEKELDQCMRHRFDSNDILLKVHKELMDQKVKLQRADRELKYALKAAKQKINDSDFFLAFDRDITVKELEDQNTSALQQLADLVDYNPNLGPAVTKHLCEKGLTMPVVTRTKSQASWRSDRSDIMDYSVHVTRASSTKESHPSIPGSSSSEASKQTGKSGMQPSIVMIDFPGESLQYQRFGQSKKSSTKSEKGKFSH